MHSFVNRLLPILCLALLPSLAHAAEGKAAAHYQQCSELSRDNPAEALKIADEWIQIENTASAHHCRAIALFALKRYEEAANALEKLSFMITDKNMVLWANVLRQASKAWELGGDKARAIIVISKAILTTSDAGLENPSVGRLAAELLLERSQLYLSGGRDLYAIQDIDQGLSLSAGHEGLLLARAAIFISRQDYDQAREDLQAILKGNPNHAQAAELLKRLK